MRLIPLSLDYWAARTKDLFAIILPFRKPSIFLTATGNKACCPRVLKKCWVHWPKRASRPTGSCQPYTEQRQRQPDSESSANRNRRDGRRKAAPGPTLSARMRVTEMRCLPRVCCSWSQSPSRELFADMDVPGGQVAQGTGNEPGAAGLHCS